MARSILCPCGLCCMKTAHPPPCHDYPGDIDTVLDIVWYVRLLIRKLGTVGAAVGDCLPDLSPSVRRCSLEAHFSLIHTDFHVSSFSAYLGQPASSGLKRHPSEVRCGLPPKSRARSDLSRSSHLEPKHCSLHTLLHSCITFH